MGAFFTLHAIPACNITDERLSELLGIAENAEPSSPEQCDTLESFRTELAHAVMEIRHLSARRDVASFYDGAARWLMSGGMSSGDHPTEASETLALLNSCFEIIDKLEQWAAQDQR